MGEKRRTAVRRKLLMICLVLILTVVCIIVIPFSRFIVSAGEKSNDTIIQYTTYVVHSGDTLWGIADTYMDESFDSHQEYINEVMRANGLDSSRIYDGQLIIIPCDESVYMTITASEQDE